MATRRSYASYDDGCAAAHALDIVGERWSLLVVRELVLGPKRFTDLRHGVPGASANVLAQRLRELEDDGVVRRRTLGPPSGANVYELTDWGLQLEGVLQVLGRWGTLSPSMPHGASVGVDTIVVSMRTMLPASGVPANLQLRLQLDLGRDSFRIVAAEGAVTMERGECSSPDAVVGTDPNTLDRVVFYGAALQAAVDDGTLRIQGDRGAVERFLALFPQLTPAADVAPGQDERSPEAEDRAS
ncbi:MAG: winged helix-turn-helix transcriptional regulator [Actinomycetota bacterium]|nr:winged helix-turn-helix transcriptional regulator [Actinomycetota bacterium]